MIENETSAAFPQNYVEQLLGLFSMRIKLHLKTN